MFTEEAKWVRKVLADLGSPGTNKRVANLGSSTFEFRTKVQPHIQEEIISPLESQGWQILNIDIKPDEGVDIIADVTDSSIITRYKDYFFLTICTNMLEHVESIEDVINHLFQITHDGGYILLTVPYKYKIHLDPIDNGFRPTPDQLLGLFSMKQICCHAKSVITITGKKYYPILKSRFPFWGYRKRFAFWLGKRHKVSGILISVKK